MKKFILPIFCLAAGSVLANVGYIYKGSGGVGRRFLVVSDNCGEHK